ncbi:hypothetical protein EW146_g3254 [Bondarzewia mesenterica]|uniref:Replication factor C subunit 1 n=1 Tax=Bondarzewia mesenterica TaxID=1095465 RepID=A0A4S4LYJ9_9AGAM|nr:hypothetical protein EW146_g3254 [Bondarzewia mesenterica]
MPELIWTSSDKTTARAPAPPKRRKRALLSSDDEDESDAKHKSPSPPKKKAAVASSSKSSMTPIAKPRKSEPRSNGRSKKKKREEDEYEGDSVSSPSEQEDADYMDEDEDEPPKKKASTKTKASAVPKKAARKSDSRKLKETSKAKAKEEAEEEEEKPKPKFKYSLWAAAKAAKLAGPIAPGSKAVPEPASPDCLAGLTFVFTGELSSFSRDEAVDLAKRFGGRVTGQPSSKNVVYKDEFLKLIATRKGRGDGKGLDEKEKKKKEKEIKAIEQGAKEMEQREKQEAKVAGSSRAGSSKPVDSSTQLWTDRYAPRTMKEICGNKGQVEKLQQWLHDWPSSLKSSFKKPGKNGMNIFRGVMITGSPGIGKTTSAHLCAKLEGFTPIELNASDARSKKLVESGTNITNTSLDGWMAGGKATNAVGVHITDRTCLIMDEVDGMSAGDRGGVGALAAMGELTHPYLVQIPIICIANDRTALKMKPLLNSTYNMPFRKPDAASIRSRILSIAYKEKMKIPANVVDELINGVQSDIRQVLNMLSTWKLSSNTMDFDEGKELAKLNEKYSVMTPFGVTQKILGPYMFSATSRDTLGDKMELYFHDYSFVPLFIQENYLKTQPARIRNLDGPPKVMKQLELMDKAASSISEGDLVDALIHGPEQHWTLMPIHAVLSTVRPASFLYGGGSGYGGPNAMTFPQWLGQNSKQNKLNRQLSDVQIRMRLKASGDKSEIRQLYIPALYPHIVMPLIDDGARAVDGIINHMDEYYLTREDWDTIVELGVGERKDEIILKKIPPSTKTALTKKYNAREHPIAFHRQELGKVPKKLAGGPAPDLEEAFEADEDVGDDLEEDNNKKGRDPNNIANDSLIHMGKTKTAPVKSSAKGKKSVTKTRIDHFKLDSKTLLAAVFEPAYETGKAKPALRLSRFQSLSLSRFGKSPFPRVRGSRQNHAPSGASWLS